MQIIIEGESEIIDVSITAIRCYYLEAFRDSDCEKEFKQMHSPFSLPPVKVGPVSDWNKERYSILRCEVPYDTFLYFRVE